MTEMKPLQGYYPYIVVSAVYGVKPTIEFHASDNGPLCYTADAQAREKVLVDALRRIAEHTNPDSENDADNYRMDDPEGCLDTVFSIASEVIAQIDTEKEANNGD